jgi:DMSO/TMAO reductase YedYZ molybdopterin-dependent catalytic subunit
MYKKKPLFLAILFALILTVSIFAAEEPLTNGIKQVVNAVISTQSGIKTTSEVLAAPNGFVVEGLVQNPLNITYAELYNYPQLSEVVTLQCVGAGQGGISVTYNWTGVPLFYLLNQAEVIPGDYRKVVFNATDGFSDSVPLDVAMNPTTILAIEANGTDLEQLTGFGSGYRVVLPCRWGYKWVQSIKQIIVVDYDYQGTYEQNGLSDEAFRPNCTMPQTNPPLQQFNVTKINQYTVEVLSNYSIESLDLESFSELNFTLQAPENTTGFFYVIFPQELLTGPYKVYVDNNPVPYSEINANRKVCLYLTYAENAQTIQIEETVSLSGGINLGRRPLMK